MEWALGIPRLEKAYLLKDTWCKNDVFNSEALKRLTEDIFGEIHFTRIYFGQEFCERAIPSLQELLEAYQLVKKNGLDFTLVTPYVTETGITVLRKLFIGLIQEGLEIEVVVNDWGVLYLLRREFPGLIPIIGRLLNKAWRDPRINVSPIPKKGKDQNLKLDSIPITSFESDVMKDILNEFGSAHIELDIPPSGLKNLPSYDYKRSLYFPYTVLTSGRMCLLGSLNLDKEDKFSSVNRTCGHTCRKLWLELSDKSRRVPKSEDWKIIQKGNSIFCVLQEELLKNTFLYTSGKKISRMIFQPEPI